MVIFPVQHIFNVFNGCLLFHFATDVSLLRTVQDLHIFLSLVVVLTVHVFVPLWASVLA